MGQKPESWITGYSVLRHDGSWLISGDLGGVAWTKDNREFSIWRNERDAQRMCDKLNSGEIPDPTAPERPGSHGPFYEVIPTRLEAGKAFRA